MTHCISGYIAKKDHLKKLGLKFTPLKGGKFGFAPHECDLPIKKETLAYVETDYFGGAGFQSAKFWLKGELIYNKSSEHELIHPINDVLSLLGVVREDSDEFDAVDLGKHRTNEDWLNSP